MPGPGAYVVGKEERKEANEVLATGYFFRSGGPKNPKFKQKVFTLEKEFAAHCGVKHCIATSSGTASLFICLLALGIKPGDEIVPGFTLNTKAVMPVHMLGNPCDMDSIVQIASDHNLSVIEDSCQAAGASYKGRRIGSIGDMGAFSLNFFKTITAGDGGLVITDSDELYWKAFALHDQGHTPDRTGIEIGRRSILGFNFRINELTGAIAIAQLRKIDSITSKLKRKKAKLRERICDLEEISFRKLNDPEGDCATLLTLLFPSKEKAEKTASALRTKTLINSGWHVYFNMEHILSYFREIGREYKKGSLPKTDEILERSVNISVGVVDPGIGSGFGININSSDEEIEKAASSIRKAVL